MKADVDGNTHQSGVPLWKRRKENKDVLSTIHFYVAFSL